MKPDAFSDCLASLKAQCPALFIFSTASNLLMLISSIYMMQVFDRILSTGSFDTLLWLTLAAVIGLVALGMLDFCRRRMLVLSAAWLERRLSPIVIGRCVEAKLAGVSSEATTADVADLKAFIGGEAILAFLDAPWMPLFILILWGMHPLMGGLALAGAVLLLGLAILNDMLTHRRSGRSAADARALQQNAAEIVEQADAVKPIGMVAPLLQRWQMRQEQIHATGDGSQAVSETISGVTKSIRMILQILIMGLGAYLVLQGEMTSGAMIASSIVLGRALSPVERALGAWRSLNAARAARARLIDLFKAAPEKQPHTRLPSPTGRVDFEGVRFVPHGASEACLKRIDLVIEAGRTYGLIGGSGSGKSTLCRLMVGSWTPTGGHVRLDGADVAKWDESDLGQHIGYLPQEPKLFAGTVAENIARMGPVDPASLIRAARLADVHELILRLPNGYETDVGAHGHKLSGGQRQRIALARALYGDPALIVLDEPNSNLDGQGEDALMRALAELKQQRKTILIVAHQPSALRTVDWLIVLGDGVIQQQGPRNEVLRNMAVRSATPSPAAVPLKHPPSAHADTKVE